MLRQPKLLLFILSFGVTVIMYAQQFRLVKDINANTSSNPGYAGSASSLYIPIINGFTVFDADDGIHGTELLRSDGTAEGTFLIKDIIPGPASSSPRNLTAAGNKVFFVCNTPDGSQVGTWATDGTEAKTVQIASEAANYISAVAGTNEVYFSTNQNIYHSDGTVEGTVKLLDFNQTNSGYIDQCLAVGGKVFFTGTSKVNGQSNVTQLWVTDGTATGTKVLNEYATNVGELVPVADNFILCMGSYPGSGSRILYAVNTSDGSMTPVNTNIKISESDRSVQLDDKIFLTATSRGGSPILCSYEPAGNSINIIRIFPNDTAQYAANFLTTFRNKLVFHLTGITSNNIFTNELFTSDGTSGGTIRFARASFISRPGIGPNGIYFSLEDKIHGTELWSSDGTPEGTKLIKDIQPGLQSAFPGRYTGFVPVGNNVIFNATTENGNELWKTDGTLQGTTLVKDINQNATDLSLVESITPVGGGKIYFKATSNRIINPTIYTSDGTANGTTAVPGIYLYSPAGGHSSMPLVGGEVLFAGNIDFSDATQIIRSNGTSQGTRLVATLPKGLVITWQRSFGDLAYFGVRYPDFTMALWRSDGTPGGTFELTGGAQDIANETQSQPVLFKNLVYFIRVSSEGNKLWKTDGTVNGTGIALDSYFQGNDDFVSFLTVLGNKLWFLATDGGERRLWCTDGTKHGTLEVTGGYTDALGVGVVGENILFNGLSQSEGYELWKADTSGKQAVLLKDISSGFSGSFPHSFMPFKGKACFYANDQIHGNELWVTDGTAEGTTLLKDIRPGAASVYESGSGNKYPQSATAAGRLYIIVDYKLWVTDGTETGTMPVEDTATSSFTYMKSLMADGNRCWLVANSYKYGQELYVGDFTPPILPVYTFNGSGSANSADNWLEGLVPPDEINNGTEVIIRPINNGNCIINKELRFKGGKLTIAPGAKVVVSGNLEIK